MRHEQEEKRRALDEGIRQANMADARMEMEKRHVVNTDFPIPIPGRIDLLGLLLTCRPGIVFTL